MLPVLIIDDNDAICTALQVLFDIHDIECMTASSPDEGVALAGQTRFGAIIQDMNFTEDSTSGDEGVVLFRRLRSIDPTVPIFLITAWTSLETAIMLVKEGAHDYLSKPWDDARLVEDIKSLLASQTRRGGEGLVPEPHMAGMIFADPAMERVVNAALQVAQADVPVLITGPNGSGKEMLAHLVQANSSRSQGPFVKVNAGGLPNELLESELFGAEPGAFTGARKLRIGRFEEAHGGALFLDEIGNLSHEGQMKLLRVLQSGEFSRLGSNKVIKTDVRVISATNADLPEAIRAGLFRQDLYFRLNVVELRAPALIDRPLDILPLAHHFLTTLKCPAPKALSSAAEQALMAWSWPGNIRELRNRIQRALLMCTGSVIGPVDLDLEMGSGNSSTKQVLSKDGLKVRHALEEARGNVSKAAAILGISRQALYRRMDKYGIVWERRRQI